MAILIKNATTVVTMDATLSELAQADIRVENGVITDIGTGLTGAEDTIDATGCVVTPGQSARHEF